MTDLLTPYKLRISGIVSDSLPWLPKQVEDWPVEDRNRLVKILFAVALRSSGQDLSLWENWNEPAEVTKVIQPNSH